MHTLCSSKIAFKVYNAQSEMTLTVIHYKNIDTLMLVSIRLARYGLVVIRKASVMYSNAVRCLLVSTQTIYNILIVYARHDISHHQPFAMTMQKLVCI